MKAAVLHRYDPELRNKELVIYQETPDPDPPTGEEVLVHIRAAGAVSYTHLTLPTILLV